MISIQAYKNIFIAAIIVQIILFWTGVSHTIVTTMFFLATFALVFSREEKPEHSEDLNIPQVHYYHKARINTYGYAMVGLLIGVSFLFYLLSTITSIRIGLISLVLWLIMILGAREIDKMLSDGLGKEAISDFIFTQLKGQLDIQIIEIVITMLWSEQLYVDQDKLKIELDKVLEIPDELKPAFIFAYLEYMPLILDNPDELISDEIKAINESEPKSKKKKRRRLPRVRKRKVKSKKRK